LKDYNNGFEFGKLGVWMNEKFEDKKLRSKVLVIFAGCIAHWKLDFSALAEPIRKAHEVGIETNDLIYAGYALNFLSKIHYMEGDSLDSVYENCKSYIHFGRQTHHPTTIHHLLTQTRIVAKLMNKKIEEEVFKDSSDEEMHKQQMTGFWEKEGVILPITFHNYFETEWYFRIEEYERALEYYKKTKQTIDGLLGFPENVTLDFFHSLTLLSLGKTTCPYPKNKILGFVKSNQKQLRKVSKTSQGNFLAKYLLVEAETEAFKDHFENAAKLFRQAKEAAVKSNIIQDVALTNERMALFYKTHGFNEVSNSLLREAIRNYHEWGAVAKVEHLQQKLQQEGISNTLTQSPSQNGNTDAFALATTSSTLDLQSIFEASTAISGEVVFEKLLKKLMKIVLENAGAQTGYLILVKNGNLVASAEGNMESETVNVLNDIHLQQLNDIPHSIIRFVFHTAETLIINDPVNDSRFSKDDYLIQQKPKSVLCQPIIQSGNCIAIIYLENNLAANAFTPARTEVLKLLSGQIAVSMENAVLYNKQTELSNAYQRFVPHDFISALGHQNILQVKLGDSIDQQMTVMFCDIRSYTSLAEGMSSQENFNLINSYLTLIGPVIKRHRGFINHYLGDGFIALFKDNAEDALHAAIEMISELKKLNAQRKQSGEKSIAIGIGLHTGKVMMGIIGDLERHDANVISDAVNVSSRMEGLTKTFGASIIISEETYKGLRDKAAFQFRYLGRIMLKGKEHVTGVYEVFNADESSLNEKKQSTLHIFNIGLDDYFNKRFAEAAISMKKVLTENPDDKTAKRYLQNAAKFLVEGVEESWDGIEYMNEK
jgi:class 3 adenylate cyclase